MLRQIALSAAFGIGFVLCVQLIATVAGEHVPMWAYWLAAFSGPWPSTFKK
jgi:hypothetical protein